MFPGVLIAAFFGFLGALIPLSSSLIVRNNIEIPLFLSYLSLAVLGLFISKTTAGRAKFWIVVMVIVGIIVTIAGYELKLIV